MDNLCDFRKWFYSLPDEIRSSEMGRVIQKLHSDFHLEAGGILELVTSSGKEKAAQMLEPEGRYAQLSGQLAIAPVKWKNILKD